MSIARASRRDGEQNGAGPRRSAALVPSLAASGGAAPVYDDPMSKVLGLDEKTSGLAAWFGFTSGSTLLFTAGVALASAVAWMHTSRARVAAVAPEEIEILREEPPPPPPAEPAAKPEPAVAPPPRAKEAAPPPPPAPARAAKVLTQEPDPNEPVDLTGNTIIQGNADSYAGGFTTSNGSSADAVRSMPAATGAPAGTGPATTARPAPVGPDRSRAASLGAGESDWSCPFPPEADVAQIDEANVVLRVDVRADGTPSAVHVVTDPGNGFAREARRCAMAKRYASALDHDGNPVAGTTGMIRVHFGR